MYKYKECMVAQTKKLNKIIQEDRIIALERIQKDYKDATSDFTSPFKISATVEDMHEDGDAEFSFGLLVGKVIADLQPND
jgi:hypothetical protein